jgi:hypothetical protein
MVGAIIVPPPPGPMMVQGSKRGAGAGLSAARAIAGSSNVRTNFGKERSLFGCGGDPTAPRGCWIFGNFVRIIALKKSKGNVPLPG